jgi:putative endonuclease
MLSISTPSDGVVSFEETPRQYTYIIMAKSDVAFFMEKFYVYILLSFKDGKYYIGYTTELKSRLQAHAQGNVSSTRSRRYLQLIHYEYFINKKDAKAREVFLKSGAGHTQIKQFLKQTLKMHAQATA